ncbi:hypothetical protein C1646_679925 [Rhizophagus diaphanus]|nr:hypothetical protein C1646_679925 [Rhizophagus diaphanus] [Rhizophagus sp. MUCL 43196]
MAWFNIIICLFLNYLKYFIIFYFKSFWNSYIRISLTIRINIIIPLIVTITV